ncbi:MAG: cytidine deaminase [Candidatus Cloacimonetes bacterium]|nr:cytidine deaminase [Candidatus Cloacimonadota bacterium]MBS3766590.1 cytidine deaminase [Candidatus Cloacimonadota bacterium]
MEKKLIKAAKEVSKNAYSPYSKFKVGAALLTSSGNIYTGTNIENSSYPAGVCAERVAIFKAITNGENKFDMLAIYSHSDKLFYPCGICRQVIAEFARNLPIIVAKEEDNYIKTNIKDLLPQAFRL